MKVCCIQRLLLHLFSTLLSPFAVPISLVMEQILREGNLPQIHVLIIGKLCSTPGALVADPSVWPTQWGFFCLCLQAANKGSEPLLENE